MVVVLTDGGNSFGAPCYFPFTYNGAQYDTCIKESTGNEYWCSTTANYDSDQKKGNCVLGLTSVIGYRLCPGKTEKFFCPKGFVTYIIAAEYGVTSDGSCDYT